MVDGKQRIETIILFAQDKLRIPTEYGDERLNNKRWKDIVSETDVRNIFLNYTFVVEYFDDVDTSVVNEIFERINKNSRKLTNQELRNARYDGWFSREVESEVEEPVWRLTGIVTTGRARRMADVQFIAELFMIIIDDQITGFDHEAIDRFYANFEDADSADLAFDIDDFKTKLGEARRRLGLIVQHDPGARTYLSSVSNTYSIWSLIVLERDSISDEAKFVGDYIRFMAEVSNLAEVRRSIMSAQSFDSELDAAESLFSKEARQYLDANQSATTEYPQRISRLNALRAVLGFENR